MRYAIAFAAALIVGCGQSPGPRAPGSPPAQDAPSAGTASGPRGAPPAQATIVLPAIGCPAPTCAFHAGAGSYFTCLAGGSGACFHYGTPCAPADACMFDPADRTYKQCTRPVEGSCQQWGAACAPASRCMFNPADGLSHQCEDVAGGACKRYGALCAP